jgi:uncharacterized alpha-E superfamily protein
MLSRTASELYWMARYLERAENTARMMDVAFTVSMMPNIYVAQEELSAQLKISGCYDLFRSKYEEINTHNVMQFFSLDESNPSSIYNCISSARDNAKSVRGKISSETWEAINVSWIELQAIKQKGKIWEVNAFFDWVKERSHVFRGSVYIRLGTFLERAGNTARILDVKNQIVRQDRETESVEYYRWNAVLKSLGAYEAYREIYGDKITPEHVAELLILREEVPRSIRACLEAINDILSGIEGIVGKVPKRLAAVQYARVKYGDSHHIFEETGLHEYLTDCLNRMSAIAESIHVAYMEAV